MECKYLGRRFNFHGVIPLYSLSLSGSMFHANGISVTPNLGQLGSLRSGLYSQEDVRITRRTDDVREAAFRTVVTIETAGLMISAS